MAKQEKEQNDGVIARNRKAFHDYEILEGFEVGIELRGTEVKSCRMHSVQLQDSFAKIENGELFVFGVHISPYSFGNRFNHNPKSQRKLLVHARELRDLKMKTEAKGLTLIPLRLHLKRGRIKADIGVCRGKALHDKRDSLKKKALKRDMERM